MRATVLLFALAKERAGGPTLAVDLPDGATVADLKAALALACPALAPLLPMIRIAIDSEYAPDDRPIPAGGELAAIPPVSGGAREGPWADPRIGEAAPFDGGAGIPACPVEVSGQAGMPAPPEPIPTLSLSPRSSQIHP